MANYQQYQKYRPGSHQRRFSPLKVLIILGIVVVIYLIGRSIFSGSDQVETSLPPGDNSNSEILNTNAVGGLNTNENSNDSLNNSNAVNNANTNLTAVSSEFDLVNCTKVISRGDSTKPTVSLTFNVGTSKEGEIQKVLSGLTGAGVPAAFFARGDVAENSPDLINKISSAGFPVYNLSYNHPNFTDLPASGIAEQLEKAEASISRRTNQSTKPFFRPPYGASDDDVLAAVKESGYCPVTWGVDAMDWSTDYTAEQSKNRVLDSAGNGSIILMQASNAITAEIVADLITQLKAKGLSFVSLDDLLK